jgi:hypothetical protein
LKRDFRIERLNYFALRYEGIDLLVLKSLFQTIGPKPIEAIVRATPTGWYARRIWFLYEWLLGTELDLPAAEKGAYVLVVDTDRQWGAAATMSVRQRVKNNLPGTPDFCPMIFRTEALRAFTEHNMADRARTALAGVPADVVARANAFLLRKDATSSFAVEGEHPLQDRIQRWGRVIGEAGRRPLDFDELLRLQRILIGDHRFVDLGLRTEGAFVGGYDRETRTPLPEHIGARPEDLPSLIEGLVAFDQTAARHLDPVIAAAALAFGFVYMHPFEGGNGRLHRYLIHHVLAESGFKPPGLAFPVSSVILDLIDDYHRTLGTSARLLPWIEWEPDHKGNVRVLNDTADFYRFFDATPHAEFLYRCIERTIEVDLPPETSFLQAYDAFKRKGEYFIEMPKGAIDLLFRFLHQNGGKLPKHCREGEFTELADDEVTRIETTYKESFTR